MPDNSQIQLLQNYNILLQAIDLYNQDVDKFARCNLNNAANNLNINCGAPPTISFPTNSAVPPNYTNKILTLPSTRLQTTDFTSTDTYNQTKQNINTKKNDIQTLRNELDEKLKVLYQTDNPFLNDYKTQYDATMYTSILWTILATSVLYYTFTVL